MYIIALVGGWWLAMTHWSVAPIWVTLIYPSLVTIYMAQRIFSSVKRWNKRPNRAELEVWQKKIKFVTVASTTLFTLWMLSFFPYGGPDLQVQALFVISVMFFVIIFTLMHLRKMLILSAVLANIIYLVYFYNYDQQQFLFVAVFIALVSCGMIFVLNLQYIDFVKLIHTSKDLKTQAEELERKQVETWELSEQNYYIANHDSLTGLPNRRCFLAELEKRFETAKVAGTPLVLCIFDLGGLRTINEIYGVKVGDQVLLEVARRLEEKLSSENFCARLAGDEFAILADNGEFDLPWAKAFFRDLFAESFRLPETQVRLSYHAGLARLHEAVASPIVLLEKAVYAQQLGKRNKNEPVVLFGADHRAQMTLNTRIAQALRSPSIVDEMSVAYQPIVDVETNRITGVECLARWNNAELGPVPPGSFIPIAEQSGVINRLTLDLLAKALGAASHWPEDLRIAFNLSATNLSSRGFALTFLNLLKENGFDPARLTCEVTETSVLWDFNEAQKTIQMLKEAGVRLSLDDFGTGYSSLSHIHKLPLDCLKVDRSFVSGINPDTTGYGIVKSMLALCRDRGITCIVEGVETPDELDVLKNLGARYVQGYLYSKPLAREELDALLRSGRTLEPRPYEERQAVGSC